MHVEFEDGSQSQTETSRISPFCSPISLPFSFHEPSLFAFPEKNILLASSGYKPDDRAQTGGLSRGGDGQR